MPASVARRHVAGVPVLLALPDEAAMRPLPTALWFHGLGTGAEVHRPELERVAGAGVLAVGVDAAGHGARELPWLRARIDASTQAAALDLVLGLAAETIAELPALVRALAEERLADPARVSLVGISMGGYLVYGAVPALASSGIPPLRAAVAILGSPEWPATPAGPGARRAAARGASPHEDLEPFRRVALLSVTAERDTNVPPAEARRLHERLARGHPAPERQRYVELAGEPHLMGAEAWARAMEETLGWLERFGR